MFNRTNIYWPLEVVVRPVLGLRDLDRRIREISDGNDQFLAILDDASEDILIGGCDERQLAQSLDFLRDKLPCDIRAEGPQVGYRETIQKSVELDYTHVPRKGGKRQFARVKLALEPLEDHSTFAFESKVDSHTIPDRYFANIEKGVRLQCREGPIAGMPIIGVKIGVTGGAHHHADSSEMAFEIAARTACREAIARAEPILLEPIMKVEVVTPEEYSGDLVGHLNNRHATLSWVTQSGDGQAEISASAPVSQMLGFAANLKELTQARATFAMQFSHYERVHGTSGDDPPWPEPASAALRA